MKNILRILLLGIPLVAVACADVASNNKIANGDIQTASDDNIPGNTSANDQAKKSAALPKNDGAANSNPDATAKGSPDALIKELYDQHDTENGPFFQDKDRTLVDKYFVKTLADMIWQDITRKDDDAAALDFDPLYNAQDTEIADFIIAKADIRDQKATVNVAFENFGEPQTIKFSLTREKDAWKIEDVDYGESTLTGVFKEGAK